MNGGFRRHDTMGKVSRIALCACVLATLVLSAWSATFEAKQNQRRTAAELSCEGADCLRNVETTAKQQRITPAAAP